MTLFASFLILGFLEIGQEIENPFSYEENDLGTVLTFLKCLKLTGHRFGRILPSHPARTPRNHGGKCITNTNKQKILILFTLQHVVVDPSDFIFSGSNQPLAPMDRMDAGELTISSPYMQEGGVSTLRKTLLHNWQQVNEHTRDRDLA